MAARKKARQGRKSLPEDLKRKIARRFREIRDRDFGSARQLAEQLGSLGKTAQGWCAPSNERSVGAWANVSSPDLPSLLAFAEATKYRLEYLVGDDGPEREGESRPRLTLEQDLAVHLNRALPPDIWNSGLEVDGRAALDLLTARISAEAAQLDPLLRLWEIAYLVPDDRDHRQISSLIEAAAAVLTAKPESLLRLDRVVRRQQRAMDIMRMHSNPILRQALRLDEDRKFARGERDAEPLSIDEQIKDGVLAIAMEKPAELLNRRQAERDALNVAREVAPPKGARVSKKPSKKIVR